MPRLPLLTFIFLCASLLGARSCLALTRDGAVRQALANNRDLRAAYFEVEKARGRLVQAGLWPNPELEFTGSTDTPINNEGQYIVTTGFNQAFPLTGRLRFAKASARVDVAQAMAEIRNRERLLIGETVRAFIAVAATNEQIAARRELLGINQNFVQLSEQRLQAAQVSQVDVNLARIEAQRLQQEIDALEIERQTNLLALKLKLGLKPDAPLKVEDSLQAIADQLAARTGEDGVFARRPDLRGLELAGDRARAEARLARAEAWGDPTFGLTYENDRSVDDPRGLKTDQYIGLRVAVPLPLYNRNQGKVREQIAAGNQAQAQAAALQLSIRGEIAEARMRAERFGGLLATYRKNLLPLVAQNTDLLRQGYSAGKADFSLIVQSQTQRGTLRTGYADALRDRALALADLQTATASSPFLKVDFLHRKPSAIRSGK